MLKKLGIFLTLYLAFSVVISNAQNKENQETPQVQQPQTVERELPPPPREEPRIETPRQPDPPPSSPPPSNTSTTPVNESPRSENRRERESDSEISNGNRRRDRDGNNPPRRRPPPPSEIEIPQPGDNTNPPPPNSDPNPAPPQPPNAGGTNNQGRNRDRDRDRDNYRNRRRSNSGWNNYPTTPIYVPSTSTPARPFSANVYFGSNDVFFNIYGTSVEKDRSQFEPFFEDSPSEAFQPLYYTYGREFFSNEFHFISTNWAVYYEPDLDDIFINFAKLGQTKFERMILYPVGDTIKKANKKFKYRGQFVRPVLVEKIPEVGIDKLYSFSIHDLPKGEYELRLVARDGSTARHFIRLK